MSKLSVVLPAYNEELMVGKTCRVAGGSSYKAKIPYELVVVNDGSGDRTWEEIQKAGERDANCDRRSFFQKFRKGSSDFLQDWRRPVEMWWLSWTVTCSIRRRRLLRCTGCGRKAMK